MNAKVLLEHFNRISDSPDAVPRLRRFILELAVRGKLVDQDPSDEPASTLLLRIRAEKGRLLKAGTIRVPPHLPPIEPRDVPFELPGSWVWVRIGDCFNYDAGVKREPRELVPDRWLLELEDIEKDTSRVITRLRVRDRDSQSTKSEFKTGDVLYGKLRPYLNKVVIADDWGYSTTEIVAIRPFLPLCSEYCALAFRRPDFVKYVTTLGRGTKMPRLRTPDALMAAFPLPPLAEQRRIVVKVYELMALCDRLEAAQSECETCRNRLTAANHHHLNNGADPENQSRYVQFFIGNLARLTVRPHQIKELRRTILSLAVRGLLVPQDLSEEPASVLTKRLAAEIKTYAHEQKIAISKAEPINEKVIPSPAPQGWLWVRLCSLFRVITDGDHQPPPKSDSGVAFLTIGNITTGHLDFSHCRFVPQSYIDNLPEYRKPSLGDILYTVVGATFGRPAFVDTTRPFCIQRHIAILKPTRGMNVKFLSLILASSLVYDQATQSTTGTAQPTIPLRQLRNFIVLLPPATEQDRIVAKADELMALCDQLETQLLSGAEISRQLIGSMLHHALEA